MIKRVLEFFFPDKKVQRDKPMSLADLQPLSKRVANKIIKQMNQPVPVLGMIPMEKAHPKRKKRPANKKPNR